MTYWWEEKTLIPLREKVTVCIGETRPFDFRQGYVMDARPGWFDNGDAGYLIGFPGEGDPDPLGKWFRRSDLYRRYRAEVNTRDPQTGQDTGYKGPVFAWSLDLHFASSAFPVRASYERIVSYGLANA